MNVIDGFNQHNKLMKEMVNPLPCYSCTMMTFGSLFGLGFLPLIASVNAKFFFFFFFLPTRGKEII